MLEPLEVHLDRGPLVRRGLEDALVEGDEQPARIPLDALAVPEQTRRLRRNGFEDVDAEVSGHKIIHVSLPGRSSAGRTPPLRLRRGALARRRKRPQRSRTTKDRSMGRSAMTKPLTTLLLASALWALGCEGEGDPRGTSPSTVP